MDMERQDSEQPSAAECARPTTSDRLSTKLGKCHISGIIPECSCEHSVSKRDSARNRWKQATTAMSAGRRLARVTSVHLSPPKIVINDKRTCGQPPLNAYVRNRKRMTAITKESTRAYKPENRMTLPHIDRQHGHVTVFHMSPRTARRSNKVALSSAVAKPRGTTAEELVFPKIRFNWQGNALFHRRRQNLYVESPPGGDATKDGIISPFSKLGPSLESILANKTLVEGETRL